MRPIDTPYDRSPGQPPDPHFGIRPDLEFAPVIGVPAPVGGIVLSSALREVQCAQVLQERNVPVVTPVAVFESLDRTFTALDDEPLGVSVTGSPVAEPLRASICVPGFRLAADRTVDDLNRMASAMGERAPDPYSNQDRLRLLTESYRRFGQTLRQFSDAGWFRYSGHPDNFVIDDTGRAVLVDLDSCQPMDPLRPDVAALEAVRDGMSGLYNLACAFFPPSVRDAFDDDELLEYEPFSAFLDGWDPGSIGSNRAIGQRIARYVIQSRRQLALFDPLLRAEVDAARHLYRHVRHDRDLTFVWFYKIAFERRMLRPAAQEVPFDLDELDRRLLRFAGRERFDKMVELGI